MYNTLITFISYAFWATLVLGAPSLVLSRQSPYIARLFRPLYWMAHIAFSLLFIFCLLFICFGYCPVCGISHF